MSAVKKKINKQLSELDQKVIVFIDDIDRLERDFMRMLLRMIRLNADFENVIYLLAFDKHVVEYNLNEPNVLNETSVIRGSDYLEKIIQVSFDLPQPSPQLITNLLRDEISKILSSLKTRKIADQRFEKIWDHGFNKHFTNRRQIKRYVNGLQLTLKPVAQQSRSEWIFLSLNFFAYFIPTSIKVSPKKVNKIWFATMNTTTV